MKNLPLTEAWKHACSQSDNFNARIEDLQGTVKKLHEKNAALEKQATAVEKLFIPTQPTKLIGPHELPRWTVEDVSHGIVINSAGAREYRPFLKKGYQYPAVSTLRSWCKKIKIRICRNFQGCEYSECTMVIGYR